MAWIWPFNRKKTGVPKEKLEDRTHLEDKGFKDAMKLLDGS